MALFGFRTQILAALAALAALTAPASAQIGDSVIDAAIAEGRIGEQADGFLGPVSPPVPEGAPRPRSTEALPADVRARLDQINLRRRAAYAERAQARSVSVEEMARATACALAKKNTPAGAYYRDADGTWRRNTGQVQLPAYCPQ